MRRDSKLRTRSDRDTILSLRDERVERDERDKARKRESTFFHCDRLLPLSDNRRQSMIHTCDRTSGRTKEDNHTSRPFPRTERRQSIIPYKQTINQSINRSKGRNSITPTRSFQETWYISFLFLRANSPNCLFDLFSNKYSEVRGNKLVPLPPHTYFYYLIPSASKNKLRRHCRSIPVDVPERKGNALEGRGQTAGRNSWHLLNVEPFDIPSPQTPHIG